MRTYSDENVQLNCAAGFEIDNIYVSLGSVVGILKNIKGVTKIEKRRLFSNWNDTRVRFKYLDLECVVIEPFGDSSRYWIGPKEEGQIVDISLLEQAFKDYQPPFLVKIFGNVITLNFKGS